MILVSVGIIQEYTLLPVVCEQFHPCLDQKGFESQESGNIGVSSS